MVFFVIFSLYSFWYFFSDYHEDKKPLSTITNSPLKKISEESPRAKPKRTLSLKKSPETIRKSSTNSRSPEPQTTDNQDCKVS